MGWLLSLVPWWAWAALAVLIVGAVQALFGWRAALGAAVPVLAALGLGWARNLGVEAERTRRDREALDHVRIRKDIDDDVAEMGSQDIDQNLARWNRDE